MIPVSGFVRRLCLPLLLLAACGAQAAAQRVIALSPSLAEMAYAAGMGENLVGVSANADYPPQAKDIEQVSNWQGLNLERIIALKPDLIMAWRGGNPQRPLSQLEHLGIKVEYFDPKNLDDIAGDLDRLAPYSVQPALAEKAAEDMRRGVESLKARYQDKPEKPIFLQFGQNPIFTASGTTLQSEVVSLCRGKNIFADSSVPWPQVNREQVLTRKPEIILISGDEREVENVRRFWFPQLDVPIITINADWFQRGTPRLLQAAEILCEKINPPGVIPTNTPAV